MELSQNGKDLIMKFEGCKLSSYQDSVGIWTIGYGNTYYEDSTPVKKGDIITHNRAIELFNLIVKKFEVDVDLLVTSNVNQNQFDAMVCLAYNIGINNFKNSSLLKMVNKSPNDSAIYLQFLRWNKAKGQVIQGLTRRRISESELYKS
jgi:lysozyme